MHAPDFDRFLADSAANFRDRNGLGVVRLVTGHPAESEESLPDPDVERVIATGTRALRAFVAQTDASTPNEWRGGLIVLALFPDAFCCQASSDGSPGTVHAAAPSRAADAASFAMTVVDLDPRRRLDVRPELLLCGWRECVARVATLADGAPSNKALQPPKGATIALTRVALAGVAQGYRSLAAVPPDVDLLDAAHAAAWSRRAVRECSRGLAALDDWIHGLPDAHAERADPDGVLRAFLTAVRERRDASAPETLSEALRQAEITIPPPTPAQQRTADEYAVRLRLHMPRERRTLLLIAQVAPLFLPLLTTPRRGAKGGAKRKARAIRPATVCGLLDAISRALAQLVRSDPSRALATLTPFDLLRERVDATRLHVPPPALLEHACLEAYAGHALPAPTVTLLHYLLDRQVLRSARNSPAARGQSPDAPAMYTQTLIRDARAFAHAVRRVALTAKRDTPAAAETLLPLCDVAKTVVETMVDAAGSAGEDEPTVKDVAKMLELATWPEVLCVGLPLLEAKLLELRHRLDTRPRFGEAAPQLATYLEWLEAYVVLALFWIDPVRLKNWLFATIGREVHLTLDRSGPQPRICAVHTVFTADGRGNEEAALKSEFETVWTPAGANAKKRAPRELQWPTEIVNFTLLRDYFVRVRAARIRAVYGDAYSWERELEGTWKVAGKRVRLPLLIKPSPLGVDADPTRVTAWVMDRGTVRDRYARALHWVVRDALGRPLPNWAEFKLVRGREYFGLFTTHVGRALIVTYLLGDRADDRLGDALDTEARARIAAAPVRRHGPGRIGDRMVDVAKHLLNDHERTMRERYCFWTVAMEARRLTPGVAWGHPAALDARVDRLLCSDPQRVIDPLDRTLPLPPGRRHEELIHP